ncbi:mitochondrial outer membrane protein porin of 36 kDa [Ricinus communis]|uniref:Voltage-dependent anion-selective channel, putative n=1 Tax=Ricinus communis TaxID=3988 RepID=B9R946_RICCO|nr:mitochondrial outer membrane protein porin of 36 kDa [Ricinus communis]EEF52123.1 voltage-dependent anion-selective channel, putative [Ricinus communis]|eukprot:XP_002511521.1 mitochondrial outer membrane protein porin of 36 kDa [Ricinus communis]
MSKGPGLYQDIGKKARDLLYGDYAHHPRTHFGYKDIRWNFDLSCQTPEILPGVSTYFRFLVPDSGRVELRFLHEYFGIAAGVGVKSYEEGSFKGDGYFPVVNLSGVAGNTLFSLGTDITFNVAQGSFDEFSAGMSFNSPFIISSVNLDDKLDAVKASCYYSFNHLTRTAVAAELKHNFSTTGRTTITFGAQHSMFPSTLMKARVNTDAKLGALFKLEMWEKLLIAFTGEMDFMASDSDKISKLGVSMAFNL